MMAPPRRFGSESRVGASAIATEFAKAVALGELDKESPKPLLNGKILIELGYQPGPRFSELIDQVEALRDQGEISSTEEARAWVEANHSPS